ncbi:alpha/beta hydrolase [Aetokthonos hydrillicola Thurmond2011]|jgi:hypothetical protein|uniref:Alpha/beta hydrolase n=1 Tax=Aetokthonos hydrillicola Thurmond2011 TaxID=2712845 RepID=A0AAP5M7Q9_9CYAN|nr:alpha/beta hydrolase [Aetokthonos hydrillicola]MBO3457323.1 alpha/beta hydrolase [Aetokthonos hydrillicola CCALA 1050]MBW4586671.1 alpha/beta hydrolase [Aetokthonos hydrillicola CCALA 1050]MDR9894002.1 alpha/beta hydrolase [Aetokthonos hydrillicola Thurmond2011]
MQIFTLFRRLKQHNFTAFLAVSASVLLTSTSANAADTVILKYGNFQKPVSLKELSQFVDTGKTTPPIKAYLQAANQEPALARKALKAGIKADPAFLNSLLSGWAGPILVDQIGEVVHSPGKQLDQQALHSALAGSIKQSGEVTLLGAIRNYPGASVEINGDRLIAVYERLSQFAKVF